MTARAKRKRRSSGVALSKMAKGKGELGLDDLLAGRSQIVVSAFYYSGINDKTKEGAKRFFEDYKKLVSVKELVEEFSESLDVTAEDAGKELSPELMKAIEEELTIWIKKYFRVSMKQCTPLCRWRETWAKNSTTSTKK